MPESQVGVSFVADAEASQDTGRLMRVLLVEVEPHLGAAVQEHVRQTGHAVDWGSGLMPPMPRCAQSPMMRCCLTCICLVAADSSFCGPCAVGSMKWQSSF